MGETRLRTRRVGSILSIFPFPSSWLGAAALSAAVTSTYSQENAPNSHGRSTPKEKTSLFPAALRERGSGGGASLREAASPRRSSTSHPSYSSGGGPGEALLLEKRPPPEFSFPRCLSGREREGGAFRRKAASLASPIYKEFFYEDECAAAFGCFEDWV